MQAGKRYKFVAGRSLLRDGKLTGTPAGLDSLTVTKLSLTPIRRHLGEPWLKLIGRVGKSGTEEFAIGDGRIEYAAKSEGELFSFVKDTVVALYPDWDMAYSSGGSANVGEIAIEISPAKPCCYSGN